LRLGGSGEFSREYAAIAHQVNTCPRQGVLADSHTTVTVVQADSCEQVTDYLSRVERPHSRVLAIIRRCPSSADALSKCFSAGLSDFLLEPASPAELNVRLQRILLGNQFRLYTAAAGNGSLVGESAVIAELARRIAQVARTDAAVMVVGETGSGKELVARTIHYESARKAHPFLPVNCGALPDHLFENEVFGHVRGAYTNAEASSKGLAAEAEGGTLFLDEVDALSLAAQVKLLRFVQFGEYRPLGSARTLEADVRCIAATNADLSKLVEQGRFRDDLLHRLNVVSIQVRPLRERPEDIPALTRHFVGKHAHECPFPCPHVSDEGMAALQGHGWPGNVRELESAVRRALIFAECEELGPADFPECRGTAPLAQNAADKSFRKAKARLVADFEKEFLIRLMRDHAGNVSRASRAAGTPRRCLQRMLQKYGLRATLPAAG
jgi:two-component system response regulator AtoC